MEGTAQEFVLGIALGERLLGIAGYAFNVQASLRKVLVEESGSPGWRVSRWVKVEGQLRCLAYMSI